MTPSEISKLQAYLRKVYGSRTITISPRAKKDTAEFRIGDAAVGIIVVDDEDGDRSYQLSWEIKEQPQPFGPAEYVRLQDFLRAKLGCKTLAVRGRGKIKDSVEVFVGEDSYAIISADKASYQFQMAILDIDLEDLD